LSLLFSSGFLLLSAILQPFGDFGNGSDDRKRSHGGGVVTVAGAEVIFHKPGSFKPFSS
jgi:hypothetical protein